MTLSSTHEPWAVQARDLYQKKISHFHPLEILEIKPSKNSRLQAAQKIKDESLKIQESLKPDDFLIVFDERGRKMDSPTFAKNIEKVLLSGKKRCVFLIGGAFGISEVVRRRADLTVSLSEMVYNHLVAQVVALEQIYRGFTILRNIPYHNE
jgi:23S rRNA (pseudouridine1915-N3)-methyltransferase